MLEAIKAAMRRLSPAERDRLEMLARPKPEPVRPKVTRWDDGQGNQTPWGEMKPRYSQPTRREWVL